MARHRIPSSQLNPPSSGTPGKKPMKPDQGKAAPPAEQYEVGWGKPPKHSRFKPGKSGNPKGGRKGVPHMATVLRNEINKLVEVSEDGRKRKRTVGELLVKKTVRTPLIENNPKALQHLLKMIAEMAPELLKAPAAEVSTSDKPAVSKTDRQVLDWLGIDDEQPDDDNTGEKS